MCACPTTRKGRRIREQREESIDLSKFTVKSLLKMLGPEPADACGMYWTALISAPLVDQELEDMLSLEL